jgi:hypothetical protein
MWYECDRKESERGTRWRDKEKEGAEKREREVEARKR